METLLIYILIGCIYAIARKSHIYGLYKDAFEYATIFVPEIPAYIYRLMSFAIPSIFIFAWPIFILSKIRAYIKRI